MTKDQTIFAPATAAGQAGVSVFRISGQDAGEVFARLCAPATPPAPRQAVLRDIRHPATQETIDRALVLFFPAPHSFTGEDVVELQTHGGRAVMLATLAALRALPDFRMAEPGEFTRRAFENGKMDLTEAEAIADLVHAETEAQRKQALRQMDGALGRLYEDWRERLTRSLAYMEAAIDFADEELPDDMIDKQTIELEELLNEIRAHLDDKHRGERVRAGFSIVLLGAPNAGKSSLLNALARRDAAIVSPTAGTTRDVIEVHLDINGYAVTLADTAGLRESADAIEGEGVRRAQARAAQADLKIVVLDSADPVFDETIQALIDADTILVANKSDLNPRPNAPREGAGIPLPVSALTGAGLDTLLARLGEAIESRIGTSQAPPLTRERHRAALEECAEHLTRARHAAFADLRAEDVRMASRALGRITGRVDVEDLLDIIFKDFCIGK